ncbi:putative low-affinity inorganic phosphate transporter [Carbonactinospora thermoautotrophica]|uniref:Putative low-affinity inorganic phosphate transporter n=1 Tax=Carbonactinospora thermoautotrophica TaxID=1469144 RepID=A0A132ML63_9ACTN|nr:putative low-affinity inorganic phosphate transporter [Carbonactinospora thermoautotrophica]
MELTALIAIVAIALIFDFTNGFHDAANAIATSIGTRALTPRIALVLAAVMNLVEAMLSTGVAKTVGSGIIAGGDPGLGAGPRGCGRGDRVERLHLVLRAADLLLPRADRRPGRGRGMICGRATPFVASHRTRNAGPTEQGSGRSRSLNPWMYVYEPVGGPADERSTVCRNGTAPRETAPGLLAHPGLCPGRRRGRPGHLNARSGPGGPR